MSDTPKGPVDAAGGLLGPVNSVMGAIFDSVETPPAEEPPATGEPAAPAAGTEPPAAGTEPPAPAAPEAPAPAGPPGEEAAAGTEEPATPVRSAPPVVTAADKPFVEQFGKIGEALETRFTESFQAEAVAQAQEEYPEYLNALKMHPLELVGKELPPIDGSDQNVVLRSADEVAQWQGAVKTILQRELEANVAQRQQDSNEVLDVVQASIDMFRENPDMVPGGPSYNKALVSEFLRVAEPYALRMDGKLTGYSIPVQGLIDRVRASVAAKPAAAPAAAPAKKGAPAAKPQAGVPSKAGSSGGDAEDFSPMWQALGIQNMPI
jgi:hypothetical protein